MKDDRVDFHVKQLYTAVFGTDERRLDECFSIFRSKIREVALEAEVSLMKSSQQIATHGKDT